MISGGIEVNKQAALRTSKNLFSPVDHRRYPRLLY